MNILVLTDEIFPDGVSGIGKSVYNECVALARAGHRVTVCVRALGSSLPAYERIAGFDLHRFHGPPRNHRLYHLYPLLIAWQLPRLLRSLSNPFQMIHTFNPLYVLPARQVKALRTLPIIHSFYSSIAEEIRINAQRGKYGWRGAAGKMVAAALASWETWAFRRVDHFLGRSQYTAAVLRDLYPFAPVIDILPTGVDVGQYMVRDPVAARKQLDLPLDRRILVTVRRLEGRMGLHNLIAAMRIVHENHPTALLLIVGKGHLRTELEALVHQYGLSDQVRFTGFVSEGDLPVYLAASDLFVLPTELLEGFGLATIEALASGLPVLGTPVGATPEILAALHPDLITTDSMPEALAHGIVRWLNDRPLLNSLRPEARRLVEAQYDAAIVARRMAALFMSITGSPP